MTRRLMAVALVAAVLLAGCAGLGPGTGADDTTPTSASTATSDADTTTEGGTTSEATTTATTTTTTATTTTTTQEPYSAPEPPNRPTETKDEGRIKSVELVNTVEGSDGGYADFDLRVRANTTMVNVDPAKHGDVEGEPYFLVLVEGELVERSDYVGFEDDGTFGVEVHPDALSQFEPGELEVTVLLMDRDSEYDDVYGEWTGTVEYSPKDADS